MPLPTDKTYPAIATNAAWQKKKSTLDKVSKTGVGPLLVTAQDKWGDIKWADLEHAKQSLSVQSATSRLAKAKAAYPAVLAAKKAVQAAAAKATTQSTNSKLNSASKKALADIAKALNAAYTRLNNMDDIVPLLEVDKNIITKKALENLANLEIKAGSTVIAWAKAAKLESNKTYLVSGVDWKVDNKTSLKYLQTKVKVTAHDAASGQFAADMVVDGIISDDQMRLK